MANHKVEVKHIPIHSIGMPDTRTWNINNVHDARAMIRHQVSIFSKKGGSFTVTHNDKLVYDSNEKSLNP